MIVVMYGLPGHTLTTVALRRDEITIGSGADCDVRVPGAIAHHARIAIDGERWLVITEAPLAINGTDVSGRFVLEADDELRIAEHVMFVRASVFDDRERELIAAAAADDDARMIYADWLEERGQWDRAELLRLQQQLNGLDPTSPAFTSLAERIRKRALATDIAWRIAISREPVQNCALPGCQMTWDRFQSTSMPRLRSCGTCRHDIYYCDTDDQAATHARAGHLIVLDIGAYRSGMIDRALSLRARDRMRDTELAMALSRPCLACGAMVENQYRFCLHCGNDLG